MSSATRKEALLNEYKGNLFEYLVSINLAKEFGIESAFLKSLNPSFITMLKQQENFIRTFFPNLLVRLPVLANHLVEAIIKSLRIDSINEILLVGKSAASINTEDFNEADIIIKSAKLSYPISLKLNKENSATNTKSAGVKSFLSKYFSDAHELQARLNFEFDKYFDEFSFALHNENGVEWDKNFNEWTMKGLATLPGELEGKSRQMYLDFLHVCSTMFYEAVLELSKKDNFHQSIFSLAGFSNANIIQATCFHKKEYSEFRCEIFDSLNIINNDFEIINKKASSFFEIKFKNLILIVRVKAMNKFIHKSFKINCSIKHL